MVERRHPRAARFGKYARYIIHVEEAPMIVTAGTEEVS